MSSKETVDDDLYGPGVRDGPTAVPGDRRPPRDPQRRARAAAVSQACDRRLVPDPPRRRQHCGLSRLSRPASPDARTHQGRHALLAQRRYRRGGGAGDLDELEMRPGRPALWRRQGRGDGRSARTVAPRAREPVAPLHAGDDPVRRAAYRRDGAGYGNQRAGHGVVHGYLFHVPGPDGHRDRHRQAGRLRRHRGQA